LYYSPTFKKENWIRLIDVEKNINKNEIEENLIKYLEEENKKQKENEVVKIYPFNYI